MASTPPARPRSGLGSSRRRTPGTSGRHPSSGTASVGSAGATDPVTDTRLAAPPRSPYDQYLISARPIRMPKLIPSDPLALAGVPLLNREGVRSLGSGPEQCPHWRYEPDPFACLGRSPFVRRPLRCLAPAELHAQSSLTLKSGCSRNSRSCFRSRDGPPQSRTEACCRSAGAMSWPDQGPRAGVGSFRPPTPARGQSRTQGPRSQDATCETPDEDVTLGKGSSRAGAVISGMEGPST